jgi:PAS domain S-box-containing protein
MPSLSAFIVLQVLLTFSLAALLWSVHRRVRKGQFFRYWAWAWLSVGVFLAAGTLALSLPRGSGAPLLAVDLSSILIICLGLVLMLLDRYQQAEQALSVSVLHGRRVAEENLAFQAEIDERLKVEHALRESESRYRAVVEDQAELICRFGAGTTITFVNDAYCRYFGRAKEDLVGRSFMDLIPEADREPMRAHLDTFTPERPRGVVEHRVTLATGEIRWQQWTDHALFDERGRLAEFQSVGRDITERKQAEDALRESEERLRALVSATADVIWRTDAAGEVLFLSPSWEALTGQTLEQTRKFGWLEFVHPDDRARPVEVWMAAAADKRSYESELRVRTRDGRYRHFQTRGVPILADDGTIREWIGTNTDITARKEAESALHEGQLRYHLATAAGGTGVWDLDLDSGDMYIDPQLKAILGYEDGEIRNHFDAWMQRTHPEDVERVKADAAVYAAGATADYEDEHRMVHKDGSIRWFLARGRPVGGPGERRRVVGTDTDVTARKLEARTLREVEGRHRAMLRAVPDLMFVLDKDGAYVDFHAPDPALLVVPPDRLIGRNVRDVFPPDLAERIAHCLAETKESGEPRTLEYDTAIDGKLRYWEARVVPCGTDKMLSIVRDVTERKEAENEARELREELAHVARVTSLGALTGSLAHEINQPLASIMANAQAALRMIAAPQPDLVELRETLSDIVSDDRRAGDVLRRLRALLTKEAPESKTLDIKSTMEDILQLVHSDIVMRRVALEVDLAPDLPPVLGDRVQLQQVALNLLINAFEAVQDLDVARRRVRLQTSRQDGQIVISVVDQGRGVPEDDLARVFEPFYTTKPDGMGLGLPICRTIAVSHGGALVAAPNVDAGMTFSLRLPVAPTIPPETSQPQRVAASRP